MRFFVNRDYCHAFFGLLNLHNCCDRLKYPPWFESCINDVETKPRGNRETRENMRPAQQRRNATIEFIPGLGYSKLEDFVRSIPELKLISGPKGELVVQTNSPRIVNLERLVTMQCNSNNARFIPRQKPNERALTPEAVSKLPPLLSMDTSAPPGRLYPNISLDRRKEKGRGAVRRFSSDNNNDEFIYSPVVCPASSNRKPSLPTAEIKATEHIALLKKFVTEKKLGNIDYKTIEMVDGSAKHYISSITIGSDFKLSTYPDGGNTAQEAMELAAKLAYKTLVDKLSASVPVLPATQNTSEALKRILAILEEHPNGVWANKIADEYATKYEEQLPDDWLKQTMACPQVDPNIISEKKIILTLAETKEQREGDDNDANQPPPLHLPMNEYWDVYVTNANSTTEVWLRLVGEEYSSRYENLATEMELHYLEHKEDVQEVVEGNYYALALDDCVHRVQVATVEESDMVHCFLLDHGQVERVSIAELRMLEARFLRLPFQVCLEQFREAESETVQALLLDTVIGKTFVAQPAKMDLLGARHELGNPPITLRLFDTSTEEDVDINQQLWLAITSTENRVVEVMVSHITQDAQIYVQLQAVVLACIQDRITALQPDYLPQNTVTQPVQVMFVDFGSSAQVKLGQLLDLKELAPELDQIPYQAVLCRLHHILPCPGAKVNERTVAKLIQLLPSDKRQLLKVVCAASPTAPASVELFRRLEPDNLLVSLNNTLALDTASFEIPDTKEGKEEKSKEKTPPAVTGGTLQDNSPKVLSQPKVPDIGGDLDVNVTLAASPGNFVVQPWETGPQLKELMVGMQSLYAAKDASSQLQPLTSAEVCEGGIYAALHSDAKWYRVQVNNILKGIRPKYSDWSVEDCMRFQKLVCNHQFVSIVEETGPDLINPSDTVLGLRLIDTSNDQFDVDISELLVKESRAMFDK
ncbi:hypothetical protein B566_EDAN006698 [Ephemera danica]|nr:hypothetical protein B566_EDAN006698 [Ephemera danica]